MTGSLTLLVATVLLAASPAEAVLTCSLTASQGEVSAMRSNPTLKPFEGIWAFTEGDP